ncbi:nucleotidyl transferase AbiEii/AbiGii toxin family protein [Agrococcus sp. KRD186]|uniref:nucleotidyl transferase AbiEii/AbiGii toxin family protein n=1 Tax=Agrococcus sp. KRD186 TaxID=2729730 RepID=UPI0019D202FD|nr:nucleotidyl transferase AbiEii/AbiGii toxin family protein [Agrococcus sp. KRD186]
MARDPAALRASLDARLQLLAAERGQDVNRLRRHLTFQRLLRRLDEAWVLKGGYLLEARLGTRARATRDLDLALVVVADDLADALASALEHDADGDGFIFRVSAGRPHSGAADRLDGAGTRLSVTALLAGREFARVRVDVVARPAEVAGGTERLMLPTVVAAEGWSPVTVTAVDLAQHVAEKLHALSEVDAHPRPSTRVKDLLDVMLVLDAGLIDIQRLRTRIAHVFKLREGSAPPRTLPDPPAAWDDEFAAMAVQHTVSALTVTSAMRQVRALYATATANRAHDDSEEQP